MYLLVYSVSRTLGHLPEALGIRSVEPWADDLCLQMVDSISRNEPSSLPAEARVGVEGLIMKWTWRTISWYRQTCHRLRV